MKLDVKAFIVALSVPASLIMAILSIWSRLSLHFGVHFMQAFNSIHPQPFSSNLPGMEWWEHLLGVVLDVLYVAVDSVILSGLFVYLYNWFAPGSEDDEPGAE